MHSCMAFRALAVSPKFSRSGAASPSILPSRPSLTMMTPRDVQIETLKKGVWNSDSVELQAASQHDRTICSCGIRAMYL